MPTTTMALKAQFYQQFDADMTREVPGEGYGGWQEDTIALDPAHTAVVVMHAWASGTPAQYPGWYRAVEYIPREQKICREVFPPLLAAVRQSALRLYHVVGGGKYYEACPGYARAKALTPPPPPAPPRLKSDPALDALRQMRGRRVFVGEHNVPDVNAGFAKLDFDEHARPRDDEYVCENAEQLAAVCLADGVNHLVYCGFAINWCLLMSPGGMLDMSRRGAMCSALRQATTAVENRETARFELNKAEALWRVALAFGFVFDVDEFVRALPAK